MRSRQYFNSTDKSVGSSTFGTPPSGELEKLEKETLDVERLGLEPGGLAATEEVMLEASLGCGGVDSAAYPADPRHAQPSVQLSHFRIGR